MKSILVDALRQANGDDSDQALSDSGSFDATQEDFGVTANDASGDEAGELELMSTTDSLMPAAEEYQEDFGETAAAVAADIEEVEPDEIESIQADGVAADHAVTIVGELPRPVPPKNAPALARFAPLLCLILATATGGCWFLYQQLVVARTDGGFYAFTAQPRPAHTPGVTGEEMNAGVSTRFPFLEFEQLGDSERAVQ